MSQVLVCLEGESNCSLQGAKYSYFVTKLYVLLHHQPMRYSAVRHQEPTLTKMQQKPSFYATIMIDRNLVNPPVVVINKHWPLVLMTSMHCRWLLSTCSVTNATPRNSRTFPISSKIKKAQDALIEWSHIAILRVANAELCTDAVSM